MSDKLKPCPFCGGKSYIDKTTIHGHGGCDLYAWQVSCGKCHAQIPSCYDEAVRDKNGIQLLRDGVKEAIAAWNHRATPPNEPLTLEELREYGNNPLWVTINDWSEWCVYNPISECAEAPMDEYTMYSLEDYGKTWLAYRQKPEEESK